MNKTQSSSSRQHGDYNNHGSNGSSRNDNSQRTDRFIGDPRKHISHSSFNPQIQQLAARANQVAPALIQQSAGSARSDSNNNRKPLPISLQPRSLGVPHALPRAPRRTDETKEEDSQARKNTVTVVRYLGTGNVCAIPSANIKMDASGKYKNIYATRKSVV